MSNLTFPIQQQQKPETEDVSDTFIKSVTEFYNNNADLHKKSYDKMPDGTAAQDNLELKRKILEFFVNLVIQLFGLSEAEASSLNQTLKAYLDAGKKQATTSNSKPYNFETHSNLTSMVKRANESILNANGEHYLVPNVIVNFIYLASQPFERIPG